MKHFIKTPKVNPKFVPFSIEKVIEYFVELTQANEKSVTCMSQSDGNQCRVVLISTNDFRSVSAEITILQSLIVTSHVVVDEILEVDLTVYDLSKNNDFWGDFEKFFTGEVILKEQTASKTIEKIIIQ